MTLRRAHIVTLAMLGALVTSAGAAAIAFAQEDPGTPPPETPPPPGPSLTIDVDGVKNGHVTVGHKVTVEGTIEPFVADQKVEVVLSRDGETITQEVVSVKEANHGKGEFSLRSPRLADAGDYKAEVGFAGDATMGPAYAHTGSFDLRYPGLKKGDRGPEVAMLNDLLAKQGYATSGGSKFTQITAWAVLAYRKVHSMSRTQSATSGIFKTLAEGRGGYEVQHPGAGRHAEVNLAKQVLVLADGDKPELTYHISSGTSATPSDQGGYRFYRKDPGFNSLGMYFSAYYNRGEATHGYKSVPTHPASHGCIRIPIPQAIQVYNWIQTGMPIFVY